MLCCISYIFWLDRKCSGWNCGNIWTNTLTFIYAEKTNFICCFIVIAENLIWPVVFIFLFMATSRGIIFICSAVSVTFVNISSHFLVSSWRLVPSIKHLFDLSSYCNYSTNNCDEFQDFQLTINEQISQYCHFLKIIKESGNSFQSSELN